MDTVNVFVIMRSFDTSMILVSASDCRRNSMKSVCFVMNFQRIYKLSENASTFLVKCRSVLVEIPCRFLPAFRRASVNLLSGFICFVGFS